MKSKQYLCFAKEDSTIKVDVFGVIGDTWYDDTNTVKRISEKLNDLDAKNAKEIIVNINSLGGDANQGIAIYDALREYKDKVTTKITGMCASAATVIAMAGEKRMMSEPALFLIHKCHSWVEGNEEELNRVLQMQQKVTASMKKIYMSAGVSEEDIDTLMKEGDGNGIWLTAEEAKDYGFITSITHETQASNITKICADIDFKKLGLPPIPAGMQQAPLTFFEKLKNSIHKSKSNSMKNVNDQFPMIALCVASLMMSDENKCELTAEELTAINAEMQKMKADFEKLKSEKETAEKNATEASEKAAKEKADLEAKVTELKGLLEKAPKKDTPNGPDSHAGNDYEDPSFAVAEEALGL